MAGTFPVVLGWTLFFLSPRFWLRPALGWAVLTLIAMPRGLVWAVVAVLAAKSVVDFAMDVLTDDHD